MVGAHGVAAIPMKAYLIRRFLLIIPTFIGISLVSFAMIQLAPGSPVYNKLRGMENGLRSDRDTKEIVEQTKKLYGLDKPIYVQYALWLKRLVTFDFGDSYKDWRPVRTKIAETLPITLQLNIISIFLIYLISVPIGVYSATHHRTVSDNIITIILFILYSLPSFWIAMLLIYFFGGGEWYNWFPVYGISSLGAENWTWPHWLADRAWHLVLPVFCLTYGGLAGLSRYARAGMLETIRQDYIRTARAYGFSERVVVFKYAMRNSLIPIVTLLGTLLPGLIGGSVIIESIFSIPGMGKLGFSSIMDRDYPMIMAILSISALLTLVGLIISDILYAIVDPRIEYE
jgi:peptide/nickel transport system permease protein